jgi:hypothetical protein
VVVFYGHPGIFVLSTHRAIQIARREGHRAVMRAGVSALDTLCADLGVDPSHPGLQTHEATDCLLRRRRIDTSLHVILWQVGLIGELGYRRQGYLNSHFSYFIGWLEELYGSGYEITHYIGARYPGTDPLIQVQPIRDLHDPDRQRDITGLSTFYIPPRDAVAMDRQTAVDLGILQLGQPVPAAGPPLREVASYGKREMAAFSSLARFRIPSSYHWQDDTEAARFLIELRFDPDLQLLYRRDPRAALDDPRFAGLSDRERGLLISRDPGAVQIAAKGNYRRSIPNEETATRLLNDRGACAGIRDTLHRAGRSRPDRRAALADWLEARHLTLDWSMFASSLDFVYRNNMFPWTGVYSDPDSDRPDSNRTVVIVGNRTVREKSAVYVDGSRVQRYRFVNGTLSWPAQGIAVPHGVLHLDLRSSGERRAVLKTWAAGEDPGQGQTVVLPEADPARAAVAAAHVVGSTDGRYVLRRGGRFARTAFELTIEPDAVRIDGGPASGAVSGTTLSWTGGPGPCAEGSITFVPEPVLGSVEFYGTVRSADEPGPITCYGARLDEGSDNSKKQAAALLPSAEAQQSLADIVAAARPVGGLLLWHKWEKASFTNLTVSKYLASLV